MPDSEEIIKKYSPLKEWGTAKILDYIPVKERVYKCHDCHLIVEAEGEEIVCPNCGSRALMQMCPLDHCHCGHEIVAGISYCPMCGAAACPECGCHDVVQISRVTGYLSDVAGWNVAKRQELRDRAHYDVAVPVK